MASRGASPPTLGSKQGQDQDRGGSPSRRPTTAPLTMQNLKSRSTIKHSSSRVSAALENPSALPTSPAAAAVTTTTATAAAVVTKEPFCRYHSSRTVGVKLIEDSAVKNYNGTKKRTTFLRSSSSLQDKGNQQTPIPLEFAKSIQELATKNSKHKIKHKPESEYDQKMRKFLDIAQDHTRSRDELNRGVYGNSPAKSTTSNPHRATINNSGSGRSFLQEHQRQQSLKSDSHESTGRVLLRKASLQLEEGGLGLGQKQEEYKKKFSLKNFNFNKNDNCLSYDDDSLQPKLGIKPWEMTGNDVTEITQKAMERAKVLQSWQVITDRATFLHA